MKTNFQLRGDRLLEALTTGRMSREVVDSIFLAVRSYVQNNGEIPMHRFLALPATGPKMRLASRNIWLRKAANLLPDDLLCPKAMALHLEYEKFLSRGQWLSWRELSAPPDEASQLRKALFYVAKYNQGKPLGDRQIYTILK